jgi:transcriptional regulator with XRE-family HTH domain
MPDKLGAFIRAMRKHRRWSLRELADRCGTSFSTISRIENGEDCQLSALIEIASAFNMEIGDMLVSAGFTQDSEKQYATAKTLAFRALEVGFNKLRND